VLEDLLDKLDKFDFDELNPAGGITQFGWYNAVGRRHVTTGALKGYVSSHSMQNDHVAPPSFSEWLLFASVEFKSTAYGPTVGRHSTYILVPWFPSGSETVVRQPSTRNERCQIKSVISVCRLFCAQRDDSGDVTVTCDKRLVISLVGEFILVLLLVVCEKKVLEGGMVVVVLECVDDMWCCNCRVLFCDCCCCALDTGSGFPKARVGVVG
jgi:hypothetical protein